MKYFRLKSDHPLHKKLTKVFDLMDELEISIDINSSRGTTELTDKTSGKRYVIMDLEDEPYMPSMVSEFPTLCEYKLVFEEKD